MQVHKLELQPLSWDHEVTRMRMQSNALRLMGQEDQENMGP